MAGEERMDRGVVGGMIEVVEDLLDGMERRMLMVWRER
jgi:hypothetical protein